MGVPGTPYLTAWANSGKSGRASREQALRRMAIRQARLEPLALSVSGRERMFNGWAAASEEKRIDLGVTTGLASPSFPYFAVEPLVFLRHVEVPEGIPLAIEVGGS